MDRRMTDGALLFTELGLVVPARRLWRDFVRNARMTFKAQLTDLWTLQHLWIRRSMRRVACGASLYLQRPMFKNERTLLIGMALNARRVGSEGQLCLFGLKAAVRIVTVATVHRSLQDFMSEWLAKLGLDLGVTRYAKFRLTGSQQCSRRLTGFLN